MGIVVIGAVFVDIKGFPETLYIPGGRNAGSVVTVHGGVSRNVAEDIGNNELRPTFLSIVDDTAMGDEVIRKLERHRVDTGRILRQAGGMGTWLAVFDEHGDVVGSISARPNLMPLLEVLEKDGDEIISSCDAVVLEADMNPEILKSVFALAEKYGKKVFSVVSNMSILMDRRDLIRNYDCFICNQQEAGMLFLDDYSGKTPEELCGIVAERARQAELRAMVVTMGGQGAVYVDAEGNSGICPALSVQVQDTTGAGDAFCAGVSIGLTYGKTLGEAVEIGTALAASVITSQENVCPRFLPAEWGMVVPE